MRSTSVLAVAVLVGASALVATPASAAPLTCGATVTVSTSLTGDLTCPGPGPALVLGAGVTLDLKGHTFSGDGGLAILAPNVGDVVVRNGTFAGWGTGIATDSDEEVQRAGTLSIDRVRFTRGATGVDASGVNPFSNGKTTVITRSRFDHLGAGITATWYGDISVSASRFTDSDAGLDLDTADVDITDSRFERLQTAIQGVETAVTLHGSTLADNGTGISLGFVGGAFIDGSVLRGNDLAVSMSGVILELTGSTLEDNAAAVELSYVNGTISGNVFKRNGSAVHGDQAFESLLVQDNLLRGNGDAIVIDAAEPSISVGGNTAIRNTGWGIYAPGVTDLGGNSARGNGNDPQCVGVVCGPVS